MNENLAILLADDNPDDRVLVKRLLRAEFPDLRALEVRAQMELDRALEEGGFDVAVTDYHLHWTDGLQILAAVKERYPDVPVIMLTGTGTEEVAVEGMKRGLTDYLLKKHMARLPAAIRLAVERAKAQRRAIELETRLQTLLNQLNVGVFSLSRRGKLLDANQAALRLFGLGSVEDAQQMDPAEIFARPRERLALVKRAIQEKGLRSCPVQLRRTDGRLIWAALTVTVLRRANGEVVAEGLLEDITDRVQAEAQLRLQATTLEAAANGIVITDRDGNILWINPAFTQLTGYTTQEAVGQNPHLLKSDRHDQAFYQNLWDTILAGQVWHGEIINRRKDGRLYHEEMTITPVRDDEGEISHFIAIKRDVTGRVQAAETLRRREAILEAVAFAAEKFLETPGWEQDIQEVLARLGQAAEVSRVYVFENHTDEDGTLLTSQRYEWVAAGIEPQIDNLDLQGFPWQAWGFARWVDTPARGDAIFGHIREFPATEREAFEPQGIQSIVVAPIFAGQEWWGFIGFDECLVERAWSAAEMDALKVAADTLGAAIQNARLIGAERARRREIEAVQQASLSLTASLEPSAVFDAILWATLDLVAANNAHIYLYADGRLLFGASLRSDGRKDIQMAEPRPDGLTYTVARQGEPVVVERMAAHPLFVNAPPEWHGAIVGLPLKIGPKVVGVMNIAFPEPRTFPESKLRVLRLLGDQAAIAIENARLMAAERSSRDRAEVIRKAAQAIGSSLELHEVLWHILEQLKRVLTYDAGSVLVFEEEVPELVVGAGFEHEQFTSARARELLRESPILRRMARDLQPIVSDDVRDLDGWIWVPGAEDVRSWMGIPLVVQDRMIGALMVDSHQTGFFAEEDMRVAQTLAQHVAQAIENARLHQEVRKRAHQVQQILDTAPEGILLLDPDYRIELANPVAREHLSALTDSGPGNVLTHLGEQPIDRLLAPRAHGLPREVSDPGPPSRLFEAIASPFAVGGDIGGWVLVLRDITEERAMQEQLQQQERLAAVGQLAAGIAHDFNNLLQSIIGFADLLQRKPNLDAGTKRGLEVIGTQGQRAAQLVRQILDFSRRSVVDQRPVDLLKLVQETVRLLQRTLPEHVQISLEHEAGEFRVNADVARLQQVLTNLAVNARDAMPDGGQLRFGLSRHTVHADDRLPFPDMSPGDWITLAIADTGAGITPEDLPHIFEPFFTTKEVGKGTGLGLAQVYGIIKQHNGHIDVQSPSSAEAGGTTFTIYLPVWHDPEPKTVLPAEADLDQGRGEVILVVDDEATVRQVCKAMLTSLGYQVLTAGDGIEALSIYRERGEEIALVLSDVVMPEIGGVELARKLCGHDPTARVVLITGYPLGREVGVLLDEEIAGWIQKPLSMERLAKTVREAIVGGVGE